MTEEQVVAASFHEAPQVLGEGPWGRFSSAIQFLEEIHAEDLTNDHWYLMVLGVGPEVQRQGLGSALIQPILERADTAGKAAIWKQQGSPMFPSIRSAVFDCCEMKSNRRAVCRTGLFVEIRNRRAAAPSLGKVGIQ